FTSLRDKALATRAISPGRSVTWIAKSLMVAPFGSLIRLNPGCIGKVTTDSSITKKSGVTSSTRANRGLATGGGSDHGPPVAWPGPAVDAHRRRSPLTARAPPSTTPVADPGHPLLYSTPPAAVKEIRNSCDASGKMSPL